MVVVLLEDIVISSSPKALKNEGEDVLPTEPLHKGPTLQVFQDDMNLGDVMTCPVHVLKWSNMSHDPLPARHSLGEIEEDVVNIPRTLIAKLAIISTHHSDVVKVRVSGESWGMSNHMKVLSLLGQLNFQIHPKFLSIVSMVGSFSRAIRL